MTQRDKELGPHEYSMMTTILDQAILRYDIAWVSAFFDLLARQAVMAAG